MNDFTRARFQSDIARHEMTVLHEDGIYRHLRFSRPGTMCMHFDLITWPGYLCYTGDMGTYVFRRIPDMLNFFRADDGSIDMRYWAEKLEGVDRGDGVREFDAKAFKREITVQRRRMFVENARAMSADERADFWAELEEVKNAADEGEGHSIVAVQEWSFRRYDRHGQAFFMRLDTSDFPSCKTYTYRFRWCCCALQWAVRQYDAAKVPA